MSTTAPNLAPAATNEHGVNLTVVVPVLNDADNLARLLPLLAKLGLPVVVSDGSSTDNSISLALAAGAHLVVGCANRGEQLARGAAAANTDWILLLHSDCELSQCNLQQLVEVVQDGEPAWGRFDVLLQPSTPSLRCIGWFMNQRSRATKVCTGDQGMFLHKGLIESMGGMPCQPLMEDIELSKRLRSTRAPFICLSGRLLSSARRWQSQGVVRTVFSMWRFRLRYWLGDSPETLARAYYSEAVAPLAKKV